MSLIHMWLAQLGNAFAHNIEKRVQRGDAESCKNGRVTVLQVLVNHMQDVSADKSVVG